MDLLTTNSHLNVNIPLQKKTGLSHLLICFSAPPGGLGGVCSVNSDICGTAVRRYDPY